VAFQCQIPRELFLRLFPTAAFEAPQTELEVNKEAFVQASMRWDDYPADLQLKECWLVAPGTEPLLLVFVLFLKHSLSMRQIPLWTLSPMLILSFSFKALLRLITSYVLSHYHTKAVQQFCQAIQ